MRINRCFPAARARDLADFVPVETLLQYMREAGFRDATAQPDQREEQVDLRGFLAFVTNRHRASQLMAIADAGCQQGVGELTARANRDPAVEQLHASAL